MSIPFQPCSSMCISGQTGSGKTRFVYRLLTDLNEMYGGEPPKKILYCYGIHQPLFDDMERQFSTLTLHHGLPSTETIEEFTSELEHTLIVLDDLMHRVVQNTDMEVLFTQGCHHRRISVIFITQNLFPRGSKSRNYSFEHLLFGFDEKCPRCFASVNTEPSVIPRTLSAPGRSLSRCYETCIWLPHSGHVTSGRG